MFFLLWFAINTQQTNSLPEFVTLNSFLLNISLHLKSDDMLNNFHVDFCVVVLVNQVLCNYILHDYMHVCHLFRPWGKQAYLWWRLNISPVDFDCSALFLCLECLPEEIRTRWYPWKVNTFLIVFVIDYYKFWVWSMLLWLNPPEIYIKTIKWSIVLWIYKGNNNNKNSIIQLQDDVLPATSLVGDLLWLQQVI